MRTKIVCNYNPGLKQKACPQRTAVQAVLWGTKSHRLLLRKLSLDNSVSMCYVWKRICTKIVS